MSLSAFFGTDETNVLKKLGGTTLASGNYVALATVNAGGGDASDDDHNGLVVCELRSDAAFIGGASTAIPEAITGSATGKGSLSFNGGAAISAGGGEISVWCLMNQTGFMTLDGQMVVLQVGGFN